MKTSWQKLVWWGGFLGARLVAADPDPTVEGAPVNLDTVTVEASRDELIKLKISRDDWDWRIGRVGDIDILSSASDGATRELATKFYEFTQLVEWMIPPWRRVPSHPLRLVFCGARGSFDTLRPVAAESNVRDAVTAYLHDENGAMIVADLEVRELELFETHGLSREGGLATWGEADSEDAEFAATEYDSAGYPVSTLEYLRRDYVRDLMTSRGLQPPAWLSEGIAQLVATAKVENGRARLGRLETVTISTQVNGQSSGTGQTSELSLFFTRRAMLPLLDLFAVSYDSPEYLNPIGSTFSGQSLGFVHFCLYGEKGKYQAAFLSWISRLRTAPVSEELFTECFGVSSKKMNGQLRGYLTAGRYRSVVTAAEPLPPPPAVELAPAQPAEIARFKADIHRLAGRWEEARNVVNTAIERGFTDDQLYATLGYTAFQQADYATAQTAFETALNAGNRDPLVRLAAVHAQVRARPSLDRAAAKPLLGELLNLRTELAMPRADVFEVMAEVLLRSSLKPDAGFLALLAQGTTQFPADTKLAMTVARVYASCGETEQARSLLQASEARAVRSEDRDGLRRALALLDQP